jgi:hypothetical protein
MVFKLHVVDFEQRKIIGTKVRHFGLDTKVNSIDTLIQTSILELFPLKA